MTSGRRLGPASQRSRVRDAVRYTPGAYNNALFYKITGLINALFCHVA
jgi:hypothetical protein